MTSPDPVWRLAPMHRGDLMADVFISNLERDGETRPFAAHGKALVGSAGGLSLGRAVFEPGWQWSTDVKPIAGTESCRIHHLGYALSGRMRIRLDDGTEMDITAGDLFDVPAGHDAWVLGDEACDFLDYSPDATRYAARPAQTSATEPDRYLDVVRQGYAAFNAGDMATLSSLFASEVVQHVPGEGPLAGSYKGLEAVLGYYRQLGEMTDGTFRAHLIDVHGDGKGHVTAVNQATMTRNGVKRVSRGSILFTFLDDKVIDILELHADLPGDDAFFA